jgi:hypothetical protein
MGNSLSTNSLTNNSQARLSSKFFYGCTTHEKLIEYIENFDYLLHFGYNKSANVLNVSEAIRGEIETLQVCIDICIGSNKMVAFNQASKQCICLMALFDDFLTQLQSRDVCLELLKTNGNDASLYEIYHTGFLGKTLIYKVFTLFLKKTSIEYSAEDAYNSFKDIYNRGSVSVFRLMYRIVFTASATVPYRF